jgi:hypothetical protein
MAVTDLQKKKLEESQKPTQKAFHNKLTWKVQWNNWGRAFNKMWW